jgi:mono/diheme cytochrome c family protein
MNKNEPNYERYVIIGLVLTLLVVAGFSFYWFGETARLTHAAEDFAKERVKRGRRFYAEQCVSCHGSEGEGSSGTALNDKILLRNTLDDIFFSVIRSGVPSTQMPAWSVDFGGPMTDEDIKDVVAFIRAWEPTAPEIEPVVFEPDSARGALLFETTCAVCHGENGLGSDEAPAINDTLRLATLDNNWYRSVIANGRPAKGMPTWGTVLAPNQIGDIIALVDAWREGLTVEAAFSVTDLIGSAIFSLEEEDSDSAALHVTRALTVAHGTGAEVLRNAAAQLLDEDYAGSLATLTALQEQWPMGDPVAGGEAYSTFCLPCHGAQGEGGIGPVMQPNEYVQETLNAAIVEFILEGRTGTAMAGFDGRLNEDEVANIVAFLRTWQP